ncbi:unnamed protein product [Didymodactylos carnosus]|uniref:Uncharacterized protein n=1 Tax=Didymodactylos carnosus TaxID=1234261 RepID=A0A815T242_9BILA|nr:unnamed protein product [Didymodactylos carnosus]CAF1498612.1 unnamed protein product [Didymodactylos carnosus]CAF4169600.1 unnamed protein product [Didymodactylos carnosus]CAF4360668.1 unnamed protein product [Didymodactylos carnosus]
MSNKGLSRDQIRTIMRKAAAITVPIEQIFDPVTPDIIKNVCSAYQLPYEYIFTLRLPAIDRHVNASQVMSNADIPTNSPSVAIVDLVLSIGSGGHPGDIFGSVVADSEAEITLLDVNEPSLVHLLYVQHLLNTDEDESKRIIYQYSEEALEMINVKWDEYTLIVLEAIEYDSFLTSIYTKGKVQINRLAGALHNARLAVKLGKEKVGSARKASTFITKINIDITTADFGQKLSKYGVSLLQYKDSLRTIHGDGSTDDDRMDVGDQAPSRLELSSIPSPSSHSPHPNISSYVLDDALTKAAVKTLLPPLAPRQLSSQHGQQQRILSQLTQPRESFRSPGVQPISRSDSQRRTTAPAPRNENALTTDQQNNRSKGGASPTLGSYKTSSTRK